MTTAIANPLNSLEQDLHISNRLKGLLPPLTDEERQQLKANIEADGRVTDPLLFWYDGQRNVIVEGMTRWEIIRGKNIPYRAELIEIGETYEEAELWILNRQLGRRNLLSLQAVRKVRGELYNRLKRKDEGHGDQKSGHQIEGPIGNAAAQVSALAGVSESTIERDGARIEALAQCTSAVQKGVNGGAFRLSDEQIKTLATLPPEQQNVVARELRFGIPFKAAMEKAGAKASKPKKPGPPIKALEGAEREAWEARQQIKCWADTIGRWLSQSPSIDDYRAKWPGPKGDRAVKAATELYEALTLWQKGIK